MKRRTVTDGNDGFENCVLYRNVANSTLVPLSYRHSGHGKALQTRLVSVSSYPEIGLPRSLQPHSPRHERFFRQSIWSPLLRVHPLCWAQPSPALRVKIEHFLARIERIVAGYSRSVIARPRRTVFSVERAECARMAISKNMRPFCRPRSHPVLENSQSSMTAGFK